MKAFVSDPKRLLEVVRQLATDVEPWAELVLCNPDDYRAAGLRNPQTRLAVLRPTSLRSVEWSLAPNAWSESAHFVECQPDGDVPRGEIRTVVKS